MATNTKRRPAAKTTARAKAPKSSKSTVTLAVDIGGTGTKTMLLDEAGQPVSERLRDETPRPATPDAIVEIIAKQAAQHGKFDRVSVGFPGVVKEGVVGTAPNLDKSWEGYDLGSTLEQRLGRPTRVRNDADVQGFGAIEGKGVELVLTLGTGLGSALYVDGHLVPNLELGHHPFRKDKTYEECVGAAALKRKGRRRWNRDVMRMLDELRRAINFRVCYLGGGNAKKLNGSLPADVSVVDNTAGLLGGIALWRDVRAVDV
jgi:polyphosphate glucokinase